MLWYVALHEDRGDFRVEPDREQHRGQLDRGVANDVRPLRHGQSVEIDDPVEDLALVLPGDPVAERTEVIPELDFAGGLDARQHAGHEARGYRGTGSGSWPVAGRVGYGRRMAVPVPTYDRSQLV